MTRYATRRSDGFIYFVGGKDSGPIKIGWSHDPQKRLATLGGWCPFDIEILASAPGNIPDENAVQNYFIDWHLKGEWFKRSASLLRLITEIKRTGALPEYIRGAPKMKTLVLHGIPRKRREVSP